MPRIPQYVAQNAPQGGVSGRAPASLDFRGLAAGVQSYGDSMDRLTQFNEKRRLKLDEDEAHSSVINIASDARNTWTMRLAEAKNKSSEGAAGFTVGVLKDFDAWAEEAAKTAPELGRKALQQNLRELRGQINGRAFEYEMAARKAKVVNDFANGLDKDAATAFADPSQATELIAARSALARVLDVPETDRRKLIEASPNKIAYSAISAMIDRSPDAVLDRLGVAGQRTGKDGKPLASDPKKAAEAVKSDPLLMHLSPEQLRSVTDQATAQVVQRRAMQLAEQERNARIAEANAARAARAQDQAWNIVSNRLMNGIPTNPNTPEMKALAGSRYAGEVNRLMSELPQRTAIAMQPVDVQQAQVDQLKARRFAGGTDSQLEAEITAREKSLADFRADLGKSPLRAVAERGFYQMAPLDTSSFDGMLNTLGERVQQADIAARQGKRPASPFLPDELPALKAMFDASDPLKKGEAVKRLAERVPPHQMRALASQLDGDDRALALAVAAGSSKTASGNTVAKYVFLGQQYLKDRGKSTKADESTGGDMLRTQIAGELGTSIPGAAREAAIDTARLLYYGQQQDGRSPSVRGVVRLALGGPVIEHNNQKIPVPEGMGDDFGTKLRGAKISGPAVIGGKVLQPDAVRALLPDATLDPAGYGKYRIVSPTGGYVTDGQGRAVLVDVL